jgi:hypothetical protein
MIINIGKGPACISDGILCTNGIGIKDQEIEDQEQVSVYFFSLFDG